MNMFGESPLEPVVIIGLESGVSAVGHIKEIQYIKEMQYDMGTFSNNHGDITIIYQQNITNATADTIEALTLEQLQQLKLIIEKKIFGRY